MMRLIGFLAITLLVSCSSFWDSKAKKEPSGKKVEALFLIHGKKGQVQLQPAVQLVLHDVDSSISYITTQGNKRKAGKVSLKQFLSRYASRFREETQPTAAYIFYDKVRQGEYTETPIRLSRPAYDADHHTLTFDIHFLNPAEIINEGTIDEVTLFIDDYVPAKKGW